MFRESKLEWQIRIVSGVAIGFVICIAFFLVDRFVGQVGNASANLRAKLTTIATCSMFAVMVINYVAVRYAITKTSASSD